MFYKFQKSGKYIGACDTKEPYSTDIAPPNDNSKQWVWNGFDWVAVKHSIDVEYRPHLINARLVEESAEEPVAEEAAP